MQLPQKGSKDLYPALVLWSYENTILQQLFSSLSDSTAIHKSTLLVAS